MSRRILLIGLFIVLAAGMPGWGAAVQPAFRIEWKEGPRLPQALAGHSMCAMTDGIVVLGGTSWDGEQKRWHDQVWQLSADGQKWTEAGRLPTPVAFAAAGGIGKEIIVAGGQTPQGVTDRVTRLRVGGEQAEAMPPLPVPRAFAGGLVVDDRLLLIGGTPDEGDFFAATDGVWALNLAAKAPAWAPGREMPLARAHFAAAAAGSRTFIFGGIGPRGNPPARDLDDAWEQDPHGTRWWPIASLPAPRRGAAAVALDERHVLIVGGCRNDDAGNVVMLRDVLLFDAIGNRYHALEPLPHAAAALGAVLHEGKVYVIGGEDRPRGRTDRVVIGTISPATSTAP